MITPYQPLTDTGPVFALWQRALGDAYPLSERVFLQNTHGNHFYQPGDGLVARSGDQLVGFCLTRVSGVTRPPPTPRQGVIVALLVDPDHRRRGVATALLAAAESRLQRQGVSQVAIARASPYRFWPGVPTDLTPARAFFAARDYETDGSAFDLVRNLADYAHPERVRETLAREGVRIEPAGEDDVTELLAFERREFSGWEGSTRLMCTVGDADHLIVVRDRGEIIGSCQTFSPASRFRSVNVVWERLLGADVGGMAAVGIAATHRGRGLGLALCAVASGILQRRGVGQCIVDWTGLLDFYGKLGYQPWREYWMASKQLDAEG